MADERLCNADRCAQRGLACNGEVGEKQSQQDADEQREQWRLAMHNNSQQVAKAKWFPHEVNGKLKLPGTHEVSGGLENKAEFEQWRRLDRRKAFEQYESYRSGRMGGTSFIPQIESEPAKSDHVQNMILKPSRHATTAEIAKPAVMPQSPKTAGAAAEQALVALASKMAAQQARNEELEAKVAEMEANEKKLWAQASDSAQTKEDLEAQAASVLFGKFGGGSSFSKSEASPRIKERSFVCEDLMHDEVSIHGRLKLFLALTPNAALFVFPPCVRIFPYVSSCAGCRGKKFDEASTASAIHGEEASTGTRIIHRCHSDLLEHLKYQILNESMKVKL